MAEATVKGATWTNLSQEELLLVVKGVTDHAGHETRLTIDRPYETVVGRSTWEVEVDGISLDVVQGIDGALRQRLADQHVTEVEDHGSDGCFPKCSCGWVGVSLSPTHEHAEARNRRHVEANTRG